MIGYLPFQIRAMSDLYDEKLVMKLDTFSSKPHVLPFTCVYMKSCIVWYLFLDNEVHDALHFHLHRMTFKYF